MAPRAKACEHSERGCSSCRQAWHKAYRAEYRKRYRGRPLTEGRKAYQRQYRRSPRGVAIAACVKARAIGHPWAAGQLELVVDLLNRKPLLCGACGVSSEDLPRALCVDHDHETGLVRGLLCHHCNTLIGHAEDDPAILRDAARYLERACGRSR